MKVGLLLIYIVFLLFVATWNSVVAFGIAVGSVLFVKGNFKQLKGLVGEWRVRWLLSRLGDEYVVYHNVYVPRGDGRLTQVDHVIVSRYQIFVLETKNYAGAVYGKEDEMYWVQRLARRERTFYNPVRQNAGHVRALERCVGLSDADWKGKGRVELSGQVQSVVVFADATRLKVTPYMEGAKVIRNDELVAFVRKFKRKVVPRAEVERWNKVLISLQREKWRVGLAMRRKHLADVRGVVAERVGRKMSVERRNSSKLRNKVADANVARRILSCPNCGEELILRNGKYGEFYGCSGFPACRYSVGEVLACCFLCLGSV